MKERDPRNNPIAGDVLRRWGVAREVLDNHGDRLVESTRSDMPGQRSFLGMGAFRQWARNAEVVRRGD